MAPSDISTTSSRGESGGDSARLRRSEIESSSSRKRKRSRWGARLDNSINNIIKSASEPKAPTGTASISTTASMILPSGEYRKTKYHHCMIKSS
jgi:hypothetical protein